MHSLGGNIFEVEEKKAKKNLPNEYFLDLLWEDYGLESLYYMRTQAVKNTRKEDFKKGMKITFVDTAKK